MNDSRGRTFNVSQPNVARIYDYFLGGNHSYAVDRMMADHVVEQSGVNLRQAARDNRGFLRRAVEYCINAGIRQFLDLGSGIPTVGNVHEVAHAIDPSVRVVYVDYDEEAVVTSREILEDLDTAAIVQADLRHIGIAYGRSAPLRASRRRPARPGASVQ
jgi:S-adenosyl methyltransferase